MPLSAVVTKYGFLLFSGFVPSAIYSLLQKKNVLLTHQVLDGIK